VERLIRQDLEAMGWTVSRAAASKGRGPQGEPWDLHATKATRRQKREIWVSVYVQAKVRSTVSRGSRVSDDRDSPRDRA